MRHINLTLHILFVLVVMGLLLIIGAVVYLIGRTT